MDAEKQIPMIEAVQLSKYYESFVAIEDVSFSITEGEVVAFLGPNGAGKSTTMKILTGYMSPSDGQAFIAGHNVLTERLLAATQMGYLPENGPLYPEMTPSELLDFFGQARGLTGQKLKERLRYVVELNHLEDVIDKPIGRLSKGYRQRVGLAQALLHDPKVLIMDEPTAGLDPNQIRDFRANITSLGESKTILLSTHILQEVEAVASRVIMINEGRLVFDGKPEDMHANQTLDEAFYRLTHSNESETLES
jgi:ABC-2 type transport system ATP-binding protein